jgi:GrpB-like predicted nucleotidyltransferase (UPF0157 family)
MATALQIARYDPGWVLQFESERDRIEQTLGKLACRIDHNGSTSVPELEAKPIIDIQVSVKQLQPIHAYARPLSTLGLFTCRTLTMPSVHSSIDQGNGRTRTMSTLCNLAGKKNDVLSHSAIFCATTARLHENMLLSRNGWLLWSRKRTLHLANRTRTPRVSLSTMWFRLHSRRDIRDGHEE